MAIFAISDLHLSTTCDKPMNVFSSKWDNYTDKMRENWNKIVSENDYVIIPGDISWATYLEDAVTDFEYIHSLNGKKLISKGNHDYWWTTLNKMNLFLNENGFDSISIMKNTAYMIGDTAICGTRGWIIPSSAVGEDAKIFEREKQRLILSLEDASAMGAKNIICAMHYPPVSKESENSEFLDIMNAYGVKRCIYGHLHGISHASAPIGIFSGIKLQLVSCDYLNFIPMLIE